MKLKLEVGSKSWPMREPFVISRSVQTDVETILVTLTDEAGHRGRGEACGIPYAGETPATMLPQIEQARRAIENGIDRTTLLTTLPHGGARYAVDAALWDLEAKRTGKSAFATAGIASPKPVTTTFTIGIRSIPAYQATAEKHSKYAFLKIKVNEKDDPVAAVTAVRKGAPNTKFIVDPNQAWSVETLKRLAPVLAELGVVLLEQPIKVGDEAQLEGYRCPIQICADELINDSSDLEKAKGRFDVINIKLDKTGGLTEALHLAKLAREAGFELMVGCMAGSSLAMAPATVLAQQCVFVDLDGPLLQAEDWPDGLTYSDGVIQPPDPSFWG